MGSLYSRFIISLLILCFFFACGTDEEEPDGNSPLLTLQELHSETGYAWFELNADPAPTQELAVLIRSFSQGTAPRAGYTWLRVRQSVPRIEFGLPLQESAALEVAIVPLSEINLDDYPLQGTEAAGITVFHEYFVAAASASNLQSRNGPKPTYLKPVYLDLTPFPEDTSAPKGMVRIPEGAFQMGSTLVENEKPIHTVFVDAFYLDKYEVTNADYKAFVDANPIFSKSNFPTDFHNGDYLTHWSGDTYPSGKEAHPVTHVSWYAAMAYSRWVGKRLPTEAEWEKAARSALPGAKYPWGNAIAPENANYAGTVGDTSPVGIYPANRYGIHDLAGNVQEWCLDAYEAAFYSRSPAENPLAGAESIEASLATYFRDTNTERVLRGGAWQSRDAELRIAARPAPMSPKATTSDVGFRCAQPADAPLPAPVTLETAPPPGNTLNSTAPIVLTFDATPKNVTLNTGTADTTGKTVTVTGPFDPGKLTLFLRWDDGIHLLEYNIRSQVSYLSAAPATGSTIEQDETLTLRFSGTPEDVEVSAGEAQVSGSTVRVLGPFPTGPLRLEVKWKDGNRTLNYTVRRPITYRSVDPAAGSTIEQNETLTLRFSGTPEDVEVSAGEAQVSGSTVRVLGPFPTGPLRLEVKWKDGNRTLNYTVRRSITYLSVTPVVRSTIESDTTLTLRFSGTPEDVEVNVGEARVSGSTVRVLGPFPTGPLRLEVKWKDGNRTLNYTVRTPASFISVSPRSGSTIQPDTEITVRFDAAPQNVRVNTGTATTAGNTVTVKGPFPTGALNLKLTWDDGERTLTYTVEPPAGITSVTPRNGSTIQPDTEIVLAFDSPPENVRVNTGTVRVTGSRVRITGPFSAGALRLVVTWADGTRTLNYTVRTPVAFVSASPRSGSTIQPDTEITVRFDAAPQNVRVNTGTATTTGNTVTVKGPFPTGALNLKLTWDDGERTLTYTVEPPAGITSVTPRNGSTIQPDTEIVLAFDSPPENVRVNTGRVRVTGSRVRITGPFSAGALRLVVTWADGTRTLNYTVQTSVAFISASPRSGSTIQPDTEITVRFDAAPQNVRVNTGTATTTGNTVAVKGPFPIGALNLKLTWDDGERTLTYTVEPPARITSVTPRGGSTIQPNTEIVLVFNSPPENVRVNTGTVRVTGSRVRITGPFSVGALRLVVTWADGNRTLNYTVRTPVAFISVSPRSGSTIEPDTEITVRFDAAPQNVRVNTGTATTTGNTVAVKGPFPTGALNLKITWGDGERTLTYTVEPPAGITSVTPRNGSTIEPDTEVILAFDSPPENVRVNTGTVRVTESRVRITGPFSAGALRLVVTWADGTRTLNYTVRTPADLIDVDPPLGSTIQADTEIVLTFDNAPKNIRLNGQYVLSGRKLTIRGPFDAGILNLRLTWANGFQNLQYNVRDNARDLLNDDMMLIHAGTFQMGSLNGDEDERPVHRVHIDAFYMDAHEVTNAEYKRFVDANPQWQKGRIQLRFHDGNYLKHWNGNNYPKGEEDHPVVYVSWYAAMAYARWVDKRLPTEAEWEKAARGGLIGKLYPWGNTIDANKANFDKNIGQTIAVGAYAPNDYGLHDMAGNVLEWCLDGYDSDFYARSPAANPIAGGRSIAWILNNYANIGIRDHRLIRGGSWAHGAGPVRVSYRNATELTESSSDLGFRCVRPLSP